jgi:starch synthase
VRKIQLAILGSGPPAIEKGLKELAEIFKRTLVLKLGLDIALSHRMTAGADFMLVPSRFEPCGHNQLFGMRYGTIPIVGSTGGLKDTVVDFTKNPDEGIHGTL